MTLPPKIKIGNLIYDIEYIEDKFEEVDFYGRGWRKPQKIKINPNLSKELTEETFFHELLHQILDAGHYTDESNNEKLISCLAQNLYQILKDNELLK